jgi:hypothetical protein
MVNSMKMRFVWHIARMGKVNEQKVLVRILEEKRPPSKS